MAAEIFKLENCECDSYSEEAIFSALFIVMNSMINFYFVRYLETNNSLNVRQYGFRRGCSIGDILVLLSKDGVIPFIALETVRV